MSTIAAIRCRDGVVLAGDRVRTRGGAVESWNRQHVFDLPVETTGAAAVGRDVDRFADRLAGELRAYQFERETVSVEALERIASDVAADAGVEAIVATHDADGRATLRALSPDGATLPDPLMAFGSGTALVLGTLESMDPATVPLTDAAKLVRETFETVAERDPGTGAEVDLWTLADGEGDENNDD
jgi:proteasome beta subunit